jgi:glutamate 5-kinase
MPRGDRRVPSVVRDARRIVVKVGSSLVTNEGRGVDAQAIANWSRQLAVLARQGRELVMVSSGAIAEGMQRLGWTRRPTELHELQAAAAVGQMGLVQMYETKLREQGMASAQVLLTHADLADRERYLNARSTLLTLLSLNVVPVINENDTVVNDEIKFGDNDTLGAFVANLVDADAFGDPHRPKGPVCGRSTSSDPTARFIDRCRCRRSSASSRMAGGAGSSIGRGRHDHQGACRQARGWQRREHGHRLGREPDVLLRLAAGESIGSTLVAGTAKLAARKQWMVDHLQMRGAVVVDAGAAAKVCQDGKSLLPIGVIDVQGEFARGDVIAVRTDSGDDVARGLANYSSTEARLIARKASTQIESLLGYSNEPEMIHRDNMVLV